MKRQQIILAVLLVAALGYAGLTYWPILSHYIPGLAKEASKVKGTKIVKEAAPSLTIATTTTMATTTTTMLKEGLVDPFALRVAVRSKSLAKQKPREEKEVKRVAEPKLEGIWVDSGMRVAFICGQALVEGSTIMGWRIKRITKTQVVLVKGKKSKILKLEAIEE